MNRKAVRNSRSEKNEDFFQRKQLFNTKLLPIKYNYLNRNNIDLYSIFSNGVRYYKYLFITLIFNKV